MPFDAAKAVAATFCHEIRYALTPVFGLDFVSLCVTPEDPCFGRMLIDRDIVHRCTEQATAFRLKASRESSVTSNPRTPSPLDSCARKTPKSLRPKPLRIKASKSSHKGDVDDSNNYLYSPSTPPSSSWVALNTPRSIMTPEWSPQPTSPPASPYPRQANATYRYRNPSSSEESRPSKRIRSEEDEDQKEISSSPSSVSPEMAQRSIKKSNKPSKEACAAYLLMQMHVDDAHIDRTEKRSRRAST